LFITTLPNIFLNQSKEFFGGNSIFVTSRINEYFTYDNQTIKEGYFKAADLINSKDCTVIGLILDNNAYEYPLWKTLEINNQKQFQIINLDVQNISNNLKNPTEEGKRPCAIITTIPQTGNRYFNAQEYTLQKINSNVSVFFLKS
jgi:hypothetical protein